MSAIAIVGMGCRFADAPDLQSYWDLTVRGQNAFGPVPADRWDAAAFYDTSRRAVDKTYAPAGAFIEDIRTFPALALGLPPRRVEVMDPQQRFSLEVCLQAIQDAGVTPKDLPRRTGVFMGVTATEYRVLQASRLAAQWMAAGTMGDPPEDPEPFAAAVNRMVPPRPYSAPGVLGNMVSAAVAQELDLHGPAYTVDAACSSALIAITTAVTQLRAGTIDAALAGGAYLQITPEHYIAFARIGAMSAQGVCRPFDHRADGFVQGDGAGAILLKRLEDAKRDGDRIYAVIDGAAFNNDGHGDGPMAPVKAGQVDAIRLAWEDAGISEADLGYLETHGTGTTVGDITEFEGLLEALPAARRAALGSSKANVGHTMSAAGIAGVIRAALAIYRRTVPPMANFEKAKDDMGLEDSPFYVPTEPVPWDAPRRVAGVSSFGFGGTNSHVVLSEGPIEVPTETQAELVCLSAPDEDALKDLARRTADWIRSDDAATVAGVARAWAVRRPQRARLAVVATSTADLADKLAAFAAQGWADQTFTGTWDEPATIAFLYPGQGSQRIGMLSGARDRFPVLAETLDALEVELDGDLPVPLTHLLYPERRADPVAESEADALLTDTANQQPALLACGIGLTNVLASVGVRPHVVTGHSLGEFTAAAAAGVLSPADAARFVARRGRAMKELDGDHGAMAAIMTDRDTAAGFLVDGAVIANINHPRQVVVSGFTDAVAQVVANAQAADVKAVPLKVSHGFHSPALAGLDPEPLLADLTLHDPDVTVASGIADHPYADAEDAADVFRRHAVSPVDFVGALQQCVDAGVDLYVQVGAGGPLGAFARGTLDKGSVRGIINLAGKTDDDGGVSLLEGLGRLWAAGVDLDVRPIAAPAPVACVPPEILPREPYWCVKDRRQIQTTIVAGSAPTTPAPDAPAQDTTNAPAAEVDEVEDTVLSVVAKVSAYPRNAVRVGMRLIEDLGFDSLMVNDLATGLADAFEGLPGIPQELLINRPSVQDLVDFVRRSRGEGGATITDDEPLSAYAPTWSPAPTDDLPPRPIAPGRRVAVHGDGSLVEALGAAFTAAGHTLVDGGTADVVVWCAVDPDPMPVGAVLAGEAPCPDPAADLLATLARTAGEPDVLVIRHADDPWSHALCGVARTVPREWDAVGKAIALTGDLAPADAAAAIVAEWRRADTTVDVTLDAAGRHVLTLAEVSDAPVRWTPTKDDIVAITGGTRGIGARVAARLADTVGKVILIGRGDPGAEAAALVEAGRAIHVRADVTDRDALVAALADVGPITAAIHAAGVLADGPIHQADPERGALSRRVKIAGWLNLLAACGPTLQVALGIGSWAGRFGNRHQAHYAAANAGLAGLVAHGDIGVVGEFGPWTDSEMVATIPAAVQAAMRAEGVDFVGPEVGLDTLIDDLQRGRGALVHGRDLPSSLRTATYTEVLSTETHPFLLDHAIDGHPVLPLAAAADALVRIAAPGERFTITDLELYQGVVVDEPVTVTTAVRGDRATLRVGDRGTLAYQARVRPLVGAVEVPEAPVGGAPPTESLDAFYAFTFHGPLLAGITAIDAVGDDFVRGRVRVGRPADWIPGTSRERFAVDPLALDSAMQLSAYVAWTRYGRAGTPVALKRYVQLAPLPDEGEILAEVHFGEAEDDRFTGTIVLRDADGTPLAVAEDLVAELRKVDADDDAPTWDPKAIDPDQWPEVKDLQQRLEGAALIGLRNPYFAVHDGTAKNVTQVEGRELVNYSSYNYIGLSGDPRVLAEVEAAVRKYGTSVSASRVASGERPFHGELEALLAEAQGAEAALVFTAGHATNVTTLGHLFNKEDLFLHDELIHDSAFQGMRLSGGARRPFKHDDPADLERQLKQLRGSYRRVCIVVEGVYSMDGDICDLPAYLELKKKYGCMLFVDEAHSFGIIGATGRGIGEHYGIDGRDVDLWMGTLSKSLASCGGWIAASKTLIDYLKYTAPGFVYSAGLTAANGVAALASLKLMLAEPWRPQKLQANARRFHDRLVSLGLDTGPAHGESGVVPVVTGNSMHALVLSQRLVDQGINVQPIVYPAVADDAARLRFFLSSTHTEEQLDWTADVVAATLAKVREEYPI